MTTCGGIQRAARFGLAALLAGLACSAIAWSGTPALLTRRPEATFLGFALTTVATFLSFPRHRRSDLATGLLVLIGVLGLIPRGDTGAQALQMLASCALGVLSIYSLSHLEAFRARMREGEATPLLRTADEERRAFWSPGLSVSFGGRSQGPEA